jgi:hypothetical protein
MKVDCYRWRDSILQYKRAALAAALLGAMALSPVAHAQTETTKGTWAFTPERDAFSPEALLDLRSLNEAVAGQSGFVRRSADGNDFVLGSGQPARFWSILSFHKNERNPEWNHHARWLAKRGVNLVRLFGDLFSDEKSKLTDIRISERDNVWHSVAAFKKEGIYSSYVPYWSHVVNSKHLKSWDIPGDEDQEPSGLLFFDKTLQDGYKSWLKQLLDPVNPHTGVRLADDPALAIIELQNEDSLLFWTAQGIKGQQLRNLEKLYGDFLVKKYGSLDKASAAWGPAEPAQFQNGGADDFANGRAGLYITWELTQPQTGYKAKRLVDQLQFLGETMYNFNAEIARYLREDLGCKQLINAGNWKTVDPVLLNDVERWSYTAGDVISVNRYFTGIHNGPRAGWSWDIGDTFTNATALLDPRSLPLNMKQVVGFPNIISESGWIAPSKYQTEGPLLTAAYASLTGVDNLIFQSTGSSEWQHQADGKWHQATPQTLGQFPAAALMFRKGYIKKGAPVVHEERTMADLWSRRAPLIAEDKSFDPNRDTGSGGAKNSVKSEVNPLAFLVGPVEVKYGGDPKKTTTADLKPFINESAGTIRSNTGEISLDYARGLCTVNTPRAQGATGFLNKFPAILLKDVTLHSTNEYATLSVVSMDGKPIRQSGRLLVQMGTTVRPTGWKDKDATFEDDSKKPVEGRQVVAIGSTPWQVTDLDATVVVTNPSLKVATVLDANGMKVRTVPATRSGATFSVKLPANALYIVLQ